MLFTRDLHGKVTDQGHEVNRPSPFHIEMSDYWLQKKLS